MSSRAAPIRHSAFTDLGPDLQFESETVIFAGSWCLKYLYQRFSFNKLQIFQAKYRLEWKIQRMLALSVVLVTFLCIPDLVCSSQQLPSPGDHRLLADGEGEV